MRIFKAVVLEYPHIADSRILWLTASPAADRQQWAADSTGRCNTLTTA
jgi:hypothetical protein